MKEQREQVRKDLEESLRKEKEEGEKRRLKLVAQMERHDKKVAGEKEKAAAAREKLREQQVGKGFFLLLNVYSALVYNTMVLCT